MPDYDDRDSSNRHSRRHRDRDDRDHHRSSRRRRHRSRSHSRSRSRSRSPDYHRGSRGRSGSGDYHNSSSGGGGGLPSGVPMAGMQPGGAAAMAAPPLANHSAPLAMGGMGARITAPSFQMLSNESPQDKINRELFVGNTPPGTSEALLMQFLNGAMRRVNLCGPNETPLLNCRTNQKFAFVECASVDLANKCLNLNGIPFLGASLRVSRPSKYAGPHVPSQTWQQLTGQPLPPGMISVPENSGGSPEEKLHRELFVGNTTPEMSESMLKDFLGRALEQVGLTTLPGNPILACRVSGKFAFVELRSQQEAANALNLNNIPYLGAQLRVGRPSKYTGPETPHGNWEDILAK